MDRRQHPRYETEAPVRVTILTGDAPPIEAILEQLSGTGARISSPVALAPGTPLRLDLPDTILLGESVHCQASEKGFVVGIHLEHSLNTVSELRRLMSALMTESQGRDAKVSSRS
jgi:hypothetical protein